MGEREMSGRRDVVGCGAALCEDGYVDLRGCFGAVSWARADLDAIEQVALLIVHVGYGAESLEVEAAER